MGADVAERVAPEIDRLRIAISRAVTPRVVLIAGRLGIGQHGGYALAMLRNTMPEREVAQSAFATVFAYQAPEVYESGLAELYAAGLIEQRPGDRLRLTARGREVMHDYHAANAEELARLWEGHEALVSQLVPLTDRAVTAATDGGPAYSVMAPPYVPPDASGAARLAEDLTALRFHRYDAHMAAWQAAGLTAAEIADLAPGTRRNEIEEDTNRRAATPYAVLTDYEAATLIEGLTALPG